MFEALLHGIRSLRSALLTGAILLASLFVIVRGNNAEGPQLIGSAQAILNIHPLMPLALLSLACFLSGSLYTNGLEGLVDWLHRKLVFAHRFEAERSFFQRFAGPFLPFSGASRNRLVIEAERFFAEFGHQAATGEGAPDSADQKKFADSVLADILWMEGKLTALPSLRETYNEYRSQGELLLSMGLLLPLGALAASYATRLQWSSIVVVVIVAMTLSIWLCNYGLYYYRRAHSLLAHHIADGTLLAPCMETLKRRNFTSTVLSES